MLDFPASPSAGQIFVAPNGVTYQWSSTYTAWLPLNVTSAGVGDFCAYRSSTITLPGSYATLLYDTVLSGNSGGWYSTSTGRFTPPAGRYCLYVCFTGTYSAVNTANIALRKNGTIFMTAASTVAGNTYMASAPLTATVDANGTDYFDVVGYSGTAGITSGSGNSFFGAFPISAAGPAAGTGSAWQVVSFETGAVATGATVIPTDDTIPQITEGNEYMTLSITPKSATSRLLIDVTVFASISIAANNWSIALFQDSTANALAAMSTYSPVANALQIQRLKHAMPSGTTSSTTFRVRAGPGAAGTTTFNGASGGRVFGGVAASSIFITEVMP